MIAADHNGVALKDYLIRRLAAEGHYIDDLGTNGDGVVDYPPLCAAVGEGSRQRGGRPGHRARRSKAPASRWRATRSTGFRAGVCHDLFTTEIARAHNDANVLIIGAKIVAPALAEMITSLWLATPFKGGLDQDRLNQIAALERGESLSVS